MQLDARTQNSDFQQNIIQLQQKLSEANVKNKIKQIQINDIKIEFQTILQQNKELMTEKLNHKSLCPIYNETIQSKIDGGVESIKLQYLKLKQQYSSKKHEIEVHNKIIIEI